MLYRTHHHHHDNHNSFLFTFKPFPHSSSSSSLSPHLLVSSILPPLLQEMECVQGAFGPTTPFTDEFCAATGGASDDFFVDELLDFSSGFSETEEQPPEPKEPEEKEQDAKNTPVSVSEEKQRTGHEINALSAKDDFRSIPGSELSVPAEGLESLEWLSHFVEDSLSDYSLTGKLPPKPSENKPEPAVTLQNRSGLSNPVTRTRTKRARTGVRVWPVLSLSFPESSTSSSSSTSSTTSFPPPTIFWPVKSPAEESFLTKPVSRKQKTKATAVSAAGGGVAAPQPRRCSHCGVTKTPQWRAGPLGLKTLCNACGVRFKSGRLLPEYRPACSPTFSSELHSNTHRKVLEMRRQKDTEEFLKSCNER